MGLEPAGMGLETAGRAQGEGGGETEKKDRKKNKEREQDFLGI